MIFRHKGTKNNNNKNLVTLSLCVFVMKNHGMDQKLMFFKIVGSLCTFLDDHACQCLVVATHADHHPEWCL